MPPRRNEDKGAAAPRPYQSELRRQQAQQTRERIVEAAADLFAAEGYARTTLAKIAAAAGVSTETVQTYGPKAALMVAAVEFVTFGVAGEENFLDLEMGRRFLVLTDRDEALDYLVGNQTELHSRGAELTRALVGAAASDRELERYLNELFVGVTKQNRRLLQVCRDRRWLREDVPFEELVATATVLGGFDTYLLVTRRAGWSQDRYRKWLRRMVAENILVN